MLGMPARVSVANSMAATSFLLPAYSVRYMALPTPRGSTIISVAMTTYRVFISAGSMPSMPLITLSSLDRNCQLRWGMPLKRM